MSSLQRVLLAIVVFVVASAGSIFSAGAAPYFVGPGKCADCHKAETTVWKASDHSKQFREIHRKPSVKAIITAAGGDANMRRNPTCTQCHFTMIQDSPTGRADAKEGTSCESCHGPASDWMPNHNAKAETPAAKAARTQKSVEAGMVRPDSLYDIAENCLSCHMLAKKGVNPDTFAKMIEAGHLPGTDFELVKYSQGQVRHRFYPPDVTKNKESTPPELARMFITGHAAALVQAADAKGKVNNAKYNDTMKKVEDDARKALDAIKGQVPETNALLSAPTEENAKKVVEAIKGKDLTAQVGSMLPPKSAYK
jgi:hypothetical protein